MDKEDVGHTHTQSGLLLSHEKLNLVICNNTGGSRQYNAKWNKSDKEKQIPDDLTYMWNLKTKKKQTRLVDTENKSLVAKQEEGEGLGKISEGD